MPSSSTDFANNVLKRLGIVKNEFLAFSVIACLILNVFGISLGWAPTDRQKLGGLIMELSTIPILVLSGAMYCYAALFLPSSNQEWAFEKEAKKMVKQHKKRVAAKSGTAKSGAAAQANPAPQAEEEVDGAE